MSNIKEDRKERIKRIFDEPDALDNICMYVSNGGSVIQLAKVWDIPPSTIFNWLRKDKARSDQYTLALVDRKEWIAEVVIAEIQQIGMTVVENPDDIVKVSDKLKALEMLAKRVFVDRVEHTGTLKLEDLVLESYKKEYQPTETDD